MSWDRTNGAIAATITLEGPHGESGQLQVQWNDWDIHAVATVQGEIGGRPIDLQLPAS